jgi:predicted HD superfamily hydrolase involved in NAD metabolism
LWSEDKIKEYLKKNLKKDRYFHSLGVMDTAISLADHYGADMEKARIAGLVHDCAKNMEGAALVTLARKNGYSIDDMYEKSPQLLHGIVGAIIARNLFGVEDEEVLNAIIYHTTGREAMSLLDKIIYIADFIEPSRDFPGIDIIRANSLINLDVTLIKCFDESIKYILSKGQLLHLSTINSRNYVLYNTL